MLQRHFPAVPIKVLCVDDDTYLTDLLRYALSRDGYTVEVANTGADALRNAQADPPDVVVEIVPLPPLVPGGMLTPTNPVVVAMVTPF
jgi:DNA-binding NtrC family response regulator